MDTDGLLGVVRDWLLERYPDEVPDELIVRCRSGRRVRQSFPSRPESRQRDPPATEDEPEMPPCQLAILTTLEDTGKRMKRVAIVRALEGKHGESTVVKQLADGVRDGWLSHPRKEDGYGYGYGLSWWETQGKPGGSEGSAEP